VGVLEAAVRRWPGRAPSGLRRRTAQLAAAGVAPVVTAGWWVAIAELVPAADRPYASGSQTNSVLELILGLQRLRPADRQRARQHRRSAWQWWSRRRWRPDRSAVPRGAAARWPPEP